LNGSTLLRAVEQNYLLTIGDKLTITSLHRPVRGLRMFIDRCRREGKTREPVILGVDGFVMRAGLTGIR